MKKQPKNTKCEEWTEKKIGILWFMTFFKATDNEGIGQGEGWGRDTESLAGRLENVGWWL